MRGHKTKHRRFEARVHQQVHIELT